MRAGAADCAHGAFISVAITTLGAPADRTQQPITSIRAICCVMSPGRMFSLAQILQRCPTLVHLRLQGVELVCVLRLKQVVKTTL